MATLKMIDVGQVQAGDVLVINGNRYVCEFVDCDGISYDLQLHDWKGEKAHKCLLVGERVNLEI